MDEQYKKITNTQRFRELTSRMTLRQLSNHYRISETTMIRMLAHADLDCVPTNASRYDLAPSPEEDEASKRSLRFAPLVAEKVKEVVSLHVQYMRGEIDGFPWDRSIARRNLNNGRCQK